MYQKYGGRLADWLGWGVRMKVSAGAPRGCLEPRRRPPRVAPLGIMALRLINLRAGAKLREAEGRRWTTAYGRRCSTPTGRM